ncbi:unnamed protein product [Camellia sinensis]
MMPFVFFFVYFMVFGDFVPGTLDDAMRGVYRLSSKGFCSPCVCFHNMGTDEDRANMGFQHRNGDNSMFISSSGADHPFFGSGWDPLVSLSQSENFEGSSVIPHTFGVHYPSDSGLVDMVPKLPPCFGSGSFSEMVGSFGQPECGQTARTEKTSTNGAPSQGDQQISEEGTLGISHSGKRKKRVSESNSPFNPSKNGEGEQEKDISAESSEYQKEQDEKKQKIDQNMSVNLRGKQTGKQAKDNSSNGDASKENYIHVRARRGQATNSHSLAERVRRERISERMKLLQELVPGCNKITGKAVMLDEIINYVQSLQQQVEFLSMKLATVNPQLNVDIDRIISKEFYTYEAAVQLFLDLIQDQALLICTHWVFNKEPFQVSRVHHRFISCLRMYGTMTSKVFSKWDLILIPLSAILNQMVDQNWSDSIFEELKVSFLLIYAIQFSLI